MKAKLSRGRLALFALVMLSLALAGPARATDRYWIGSTGGYWDNSANWSLPDGGLGGAGQPQAGDDVYLTQSLSGGDLTLEYRNSGPTVQLGTLYIFGFGSGLLTLDQSSGGQLLTTREFIGTVGRGAYNQSSGTNTVSGELRLGYYSGSLGTYNLQGGSLSAGTETLGFSGSGAFTQSGGSNTVSGTLYLGNYCRQQRHLRAPGRQPLLQLAGHRQRRRGASARAAAASRPITRSSACTAAAP